jgi:hypothetical protein
MKDLLLITTIEMVAITGKNVKVAMFFPQKGNQSPPAGIIFTDIKNKVVDQFVFSI